jgi:hypothetical protein
MLTVKIDRAKRGIVRMRLERALLVEKLEEKTPAHVDGSEGSDSELSSVSPQSPLYTGRLAFEAFLAFRPVEALVSSALLSSEYGG